jgi:hypothetical protein
MGVSEISVECNAYENVMVLIERFCNPQIRYRPDW